MADTQQEPAPALMEEVVARMSEEAQKIGFGFVRLPKTEDVNGWIILLEGDAPEEGVYVRVIVKKPSQEAG